MSLKLSAKFWKNAVKNGDLSINEQHCIVSDHCSIAVHPNARDYYHVAILNLGELNQLMDEHKFVAQYDR